MIHRSRWGLEMKNDVLLLILSGSLLVTASCQNRSDDLEIDFKVPVNVSTVEISTIERTLPSTGTLRALREATLTSETAGYITIGLNESEKRRLEEGDVVREGDVVSVLDSEEIRVSTTSGRAARYKAYMAAKEEYEKNKELYKQGIITTSTLSGFESNMLSAKYDYESTLITETKRKIVSPIDGTLTYLARVVDGERIEPGFKVATIMDFGKVIADFDISGGELKEVTEGQEVKITQYAYAGEGFTGKIRYVSPTIDPQSRTFRVEVLLDNDERKLRPGMFARGDIVVESKEDVVVIPKHLVQIRNNRPVVFIVERQKAIEKEVKTGIEDKENVEIIKGLEPGDRIVTQGYETLKDRAKVRITG